MTAIAAIQTTLAAEHAAVHVYGALGARTSQSGSPILYAAISGAYAQHRARRDFLTAEVRGLEESPVAAAPAYELPAAGGSAGSAAAAALDLERSCAATYAFLVASSEGRLRRWAVTALTDAAVRALDFGSAPEPFPGIDD